MMNHVRISNSAHAVYKVRLLVRNEGSLFGVGNVESDVADF